MPLIESSYKAPLLFGGGHTSTILTKLFRKVDGVSFNRKRISTPDNDFLDLDFSKKGNGKIAVLVHGLEGSSESTYMQGMAKELNNNEWDAVCFNMRGCSGEVNLLFSAYHSGKTDDLNLVINQIKNDYQTIILIGFSLGGNLLLKYLGENENRLDSNIKLGIAISAPCDLEGSAVELKKAKNILYMQRFLKTMKAKAREKYKLHPESNLNLEKIEKAKDFHEFDNLYTAPAHGFNDVYDYWSKCSSKQFLANISIPTLLINATNDPFLSESCYPIEEAKNNSNLFLEIPKNGGHLGFLSPSGFRGKSWLEKRVIEFINLHFNIADMSNNSLGKRRPIT
ncbi:MAG: alpha/beta fold hydrolase [Flavobacteriales bacterium]|nr:alpha/beta fold hydrolase [Flavobacteriales bacterium]